MYIYYIHVQKDKWNEDKNKRRKKKNRKQLHKHIELVYNGVYKTRVTI